MNEHKTRGEVIVTVLVLLALLGGGLFVLKPKWMSGDSRRAETATQTTQQLVQATDKQGAVAAASVVKIGEANALAPESPQKAFIAREVPVALASLPQPDQTALIESERRKSAILEGRLQEAADLYEKAMKQADSLEKAKQAALQAKTKSDLELVQVAAERLGADRQANAAIAVAVIAGLLYLYVKFTHVSPGAMASIASDLRSQGGESGKIGIQIIDTATSRLQQGVISIIHKLFHSE